MCSLLAVYSAHIFRMLIDIVAHLRSPLNAACVHARSLNCSAVQTRQPSRCVLYATVMVNRAVLWREYAIDAAPSQRRMDRSHGIALANVPSTPRRCGHFDLRHRTMQQITDLCRYHFLSTYFLHSLIITLFALFSIPHSSPSFTV